MYKTNRKDSYRSTKTKITEIGEKLVVIGNIVKLVIFCS